MSLGGCNKVLQEQPRATYTPVFFTTQAGVIGGLTEMYSHLRYMYGQGYRYNTLEVGTDESTYGSSADANFLTSGYDDGMKGVINATTSRSDVIWSLSLHAILIRPAVVIQYGSKAGVGAAR